MGKFLLTVFAGLSELERNLINKRTEEGRASAKKRGVKFGRKFKLTPHQRDQVHTMLKDCGKACNGVPQRAKIGDQVDPPSFVVETPFHRATPFHQATTERPAGLICGEKIGLARRRLPPDCRSVPKWVRNER